MPFRPGFKVAVTAVRKLPVLLEMPLALLPEWALDTGYFSPYGHAAALVLPVTRLV
jgi:hypothetical protein